MALARENRFARDGFAALRGRSAVRDRRRRLRLRRTEARRVAAALPSRIFGGGR